MSRPRQTKESREAAAKDAFRQEVRVQRAVLDMTQGELADAVGMDRSVLSRFLADPDKLSVGRMRGISQALGLDPLTVLALMGYEKKDVIRRITEN